MTPESPLVFVIAGEPSGDILGAGLMAELKAARPGVRFAGIGGPRMEAEGLSSLIPMSELTLMGLAEVLPRIPRLLRHIRQTADEIMKLNPDAVVTIDAPDFCFRVARKVHGRGIPLIHYVAPSVWAWRPGRAEKIAKFLDHLLVLLPFEPPYFERYGLACTFVGHPVVASGADGGDAERFRREYGVADDNQLLCVLPGSRKGEVARLLPIFGQALEILRRDHPGLRVVVPTLPNVEYDVRIAAAHWPVPSVAVDGQCAKFDAFAAAAAALAASGTVTLELALAGLPMVVGYRVNPLTAWVARRLIRLKWVSLVNILLDREVVPEHLQEDCTPERLAASIHRLLTDHEARNAQRDQCRKALEMLGLGGPSPDERAAAAVLAVLDNRLPAAPAPLGGT